MRNTLKVAKWEIKKNMTNKSFIIGLFITPLIFLFFFFVPSLFDDSTEQSAIDLFIKDELHVIDDLNEQIEENEFIDWQIQETDLDNKSIMNQIETNENSAFIHLTEDDLNEGVISVYTNEEIDEYFIDQIGFLEEPLRKVQLEHQGFSDTELELITRGVAFEEVALAPESDQKDEQETNDEEFNMEDPLEGLIPGAFAGIILFSIVISGMMIFQSASQEKKDKIAEIILSSLTPNELMQGKIIGYFALGIIQVTIWLGIALPVASFKMDVPIFEYLFVPELAILLLIAVLGYLLFASLFVGIGATIEDVSTSGNFQGMVLMLPFLPLIFMGPVLTNPSGIIAKVASFIPFTSPGILIIRLSMLEEWPWIEVALAILVLLVSVWLFMKLAGKIFKTGILLYGKNATPKEIWKWLWM